MWTVGSVIVVIIIKQIIIFIKLIITIKYHTYTVEPLI